jgi:hypothetical protein
MIARKIRESIHTEDRVIFKILRCRIQVPNMHGAFGSLAMLLNSITVGRFPYSQDDALVYIYSTWILAAQLIRRLPVPAGPITNCTKRPMLAMDQGEMRDEMNEPRN